MKVKKHMDAEALKEKLIYIKSNNFLPGKENIPETVGEMMRHIGSVDPVLRDELIYSTFYKWTINGVLTPAHMESILKLCLDKNHLFFGIGEKDTDSVFTRTFSVLLIPLAFYTDGRDRFLTEKRVGGIRESVIRYLSLEADVRGYVEGKGWAHSTAHAADALEDIAKSEYTGRGGLLEILEAIKAKICIDYYTYINNEDDRVAAAAVSVFRRGLLSRREIADWAGSFNSLKMTGTYPQDLHMSVNRKNFLRSLYFALRGPADMSAIADEIADSIKDIH